MSEDNYHGQDRRHNDDLIIHRLDQHDDQLNKLVDIATQLSRIEERSVNHNGLLIRVVARQDNIEERTERIEMELARLAGGAKVGRAVGAALIAIVSAVITWFTSQPPPT